MIGVGSLKIEACEGGISDGRMEVRSLSRGETVGVGKDRNGGGGTKEIVAQCYEKSKNSTI